MQWHRHFYELGYCSIYQFPVPQQKSFWFDRLSGKPRTRKWVGKKLQMLVVKTRDSK